MLKILFITDYVCPYCFVAERALHQALVETGIAADIILQPMELSPEGKPQVDTFNDPVRRSHYQILTEPARQMGLNMKLPPHIIPRPRTRLAFEGRCFAIENGKEEAYNELMYSAYFTEEQDIGNIDVLCALAGRIGLNVNRYREMLETGIYSDYQAEQNRISREQYNPSGVPTVYINGTKIEIESYTVEEMKQILTSFEDKGKNSASDEYSVSDDCSGLEELHGFRGCGPDGC